MPHKPRQKSHSGVYHVFVHGISDEQIFKEKREKKQFKKFLRELKKEFDSEIYAYCIMSNHSHLVIKSEYEELSRIMAKILSEYANYYNYKHNRVGHVFRNRFGSECIEDEKYLLNCLRYVHMNPVKAFMVSEVTSYEYSSIQEYRTGKADIVHENAIKYYKSKFKDWNAFLEYHHLPGEFVFKDIAGEVYWQLQDQTMQLLWEFQEINKLDNPVEVLEDPELREVFKEELKNKLKVSGARRNRLYNDLKKKLIG